MEAEKLAIGFGERRQFGRRRWVVNGLRVFRMMWHNFDRRLAFPVIIAESADEAHAIAVERVPVDPRFWPPKEGSCLRAFGLSEEERRESVLEWIADSNFEVGEIEALAQKCANEFLPVSRARREEGGRRG